MRTGSSGTLTCHLFKPHCPGPPRLPRLGITHPGGCLGAPSLHPRGPSCYFSITISENCVSHIGPHCHCKQFRHTEPRPPGLPTPGAVRFSEGPYEWPGFSFFQVCMLCTKSDKFVKQLKKNVCMLGRGILFSNLLFFADTRPGRVSLRAV